MAAGRLLIPGWSRALDSDGGPISARISLFDTGMDNLAAVYANEALTVPLANPVESNSAGRFPAIWADDSVTYDWSVEAPYGPPGSPFTGTGLTTASTADTLNAAAAEAAADQAAIDAAIAADALADIIALGEASPDTDPTVIAGKVSYNVLAASGGSDLVGFLQAGTGAVARTSQDKLRDVVSVLDFIPVAEHAAILAGMSTYDATASINAAFAASSTVHFPGSTSRALYNATAITMGFGRRMVGDGRQSVRVRQVAATDSDFITFTTGGVIGDITGGSFGLENVQIEPADVGRAAVKIGPNVRASMFCTQGVTIKSQHAATLGAYPYSTTAGQIGIDVDGTGGAVFLARHAGLIIQSCDIAIRADDVVNDWQFDGGCWMVDNRVGFDINNCSIWRSLTTHESGVLNARAWVLRGTTANVHSIAERWELTQAGSYGIEFAGGFTGNNIRIHDPLVLVNGDGGSISAGRKYTGTPPADFVFFGYYLDAIDAAQRPFLIVPGNVPMKMPSQMRVGGSGTGDGTIILGRDANNGALCYFHHDGTHLRIRAGNSLRLFGDGSGGDGTGYKVDVTSLGVGFNGQNGVAPPSVGAAATDLPTALTLLNNIRTAGINNGLWTA